MALYDELKNGRIGSYVLVERMDGVDAGKSLKEAAALAVAQKKQLFGLFGGPEGHFDLAGSHRQRLIPWTLEAISQNPRR